MRNEGYISIPKRKCCAKMFTRSLRRNDVREEAARAKNFIKRELLRDGEDAQRDADAPRAKRGERKSAREKSRGPREECRGIEEENRETVENRETGCARISGGVVGEVYSEG